MLQSWAACAHSHFVFLVLGMARAWRWCSLTTASCTRERLVVRWPRVEPCWHSRLKVPCSSLQHYEQWRAAADPPVRRSHRAVRLLAEPGPSDLCHDAAPHRLPCLCAQVACPRFSRISESGWLFMAVSAESGTSTGLMNAAAAAMPVLNVTHFVDHVLFSQVLRTLGVLHMATRHTSASPLTIRSPTMPTRCVS